MTITWDLVTYVNTYNLNSIIATSLPTFVKYLHQSSEVKHHYLYTHEFQTYLIQPQCQHLSLAATTLLSYITYPSDLTDIAETKQD